MNNGINIERDINWLDVIFLKDFQIYLNKLTLKELSLLSKLIREKLAYLVFNNILIEDSKLTYDIYYFGLTNAYRRQEFTKMEIEQFKESKVFKNYLNRREYKNLVIDPYLNSMKEKFHYSKLVKSLTFNQVYQPLYYIINLVELTTNLNSLYIDVGFLLIKEFQLILNGLKNLKELILSNVTFVKFKTDESSNYTLSIPISLKELTISDAKLIIRHYKKGAYQLLFEGFSIEPIPLPIKDDHLPNLSYFEYDTEYPVGPFFNNFLLANAHIDTLKMSFKTLIQENIETIIISQCIHIVLHPSNSLDYTLVNARFNELKYITIFELDTIPDIQHNSLHRLLLSCENLKILYINLDNVQFNNIDIIINNLNLLNFINIDTRKVFVDISPKVLTNATYWMLYYKILDFSERLLLNAPPNLKEIMFDLSELGETNSLSINSILQRYRDWSYEFKGCNGTWSREEIN